MTEHPTALRLGTLKGFRDYLPDVMIPRERLIDTARRVYRSYGFSPIDTPALEYLEILAGKGGEETDKQLYKFQDHGGRWVGLRFDLTVPLARFAAQHVNELGTPLKRYHIATVWRGENTQRGRYREFMQCDFDTIGTHSIAADIETALVIHDLLRAIGFADFTIRLNNRMVLDGLLERLDLADRATAVLARAGQARQDRAGKGGRGDGRRRPAPRRSRPSKCSGWREIAGTTTQCSARSSRWWPAARRARRAWRSSRKLLDGAAGGRRARRAVPARSLDRPRTGLLHRHDLRDLFGRPAGHRQRLLGRALRQPGRAVHRPGTARHRRLAGPGPPAGGDGRAGHDRKGLRRRPRCSSPFSTKPGCTTICGWRPRLRAAGIGVEVFPDPKKLGQQLKYADRRGFRVALIAGATSSNRASAR